MLQKCKFSSLLFVLACIASFSGSLTITTAVHQHGDGASGHSHSHSHSHPHSHEADDESPFAAYRRKKEAETSNTANSVADARIPQPETKNQKGVEKSTPHMHIVFLGFEFSLTLSNQSDVPEFSETQNSLATATHLITQNQDETRISDSSSGVETSRFPWMLVKFLGEYSFTSRAFPYQRSYAEVPLSIWLDIATPPPRLLS
jgi:hypothetical protein